MAIITGILTFILVIGVLVFFHELGHFLFAKLFKMKVEDFSLGFGPRLIRVVHDGSRYRLKFGEEQQTSSKEPNTKTEYNLRLLPIGGFVRIKGMEIEDETERRLTGTVKKSDTDTGFETTNTSTMRQETAEVSGDDGDGFNSRPIYQRFWVIFGGPLFSFILGWLALCMIGFTFGLGTPVTTTEIQTVVAGKPAANVGIKSGDKVVSINGTPIKTGEQMVDLIHQFPNKSITMELQSKKGDTRTVTVVPDSATDVDGKKIGLIGIAPVIIATNIQRVGIAESFAVGNRNVVFWFTSMAGLFAKPKELGNSVGGPVAIFKASQDASTQGGSSVLGLLGQLSLSLGLFNLFPIPVLDGGHLSLMFLEAIRRRKLTAAQTNGVFTVGFALIMLLAAVVLFKDVKGLFIK